MSTPEAPLRLDTHAGAAFLGCADATLRKSRVTGTLLGRPAPAYRKVGRKVLYDRETLIAWLEQFEPQRSTAAHGRGAAA